MIEERIDCVKKEIRSVLIISKGGLSLEDFHKTYKNLIGIRLPFREFGFTSDIDFLYSLPDVVHIQVERNGSYQLHGIADKSTEHIQKLVSKQKQPKVNPSRKSAIDYSNGAKSYQKFVPIVTQRCRPFVPALLRAEIVEIVKQYPDGISYLSLIQAYQNFYKKEINLEWLSNDPEEKFKKLANAVPELDLKLVHNQLKIHYSNFHDVVETKDTPACNQQPAKAVAKVSPKFKSIDIEHNKKILEASAIPETVKSNFIKVLNQYPKGILAVHFPILYEHLTKLPLNLHDLGFSSLIELADALPHIFSRKNIPESSKDWILFHPNFSKQVSSSLESKSHSPNVPPVKLSSSYCLKGNLPSDIAHPSLPYVQKEFPDNTEKFIPVFVSSIINPSLFWIQLQTEEAISNLKKLENEMKYFYNQFGDCYQLADADVLIGSSCVAFSTTRFQWFRALIISLPTIDHANVSFVDYGSGEKVHKSNLYYLKYTFINLPAHAHKSTLASIKPVNQVSKWNLKAQKRFLGLCNKVILMAKVDSLENDLLALLLCDTSEDKNTYINDVLVSEGYAEFCLSDNLNPKHSSNVPSLHVENGMKLFSTSNSEKQTVDRAKSNISDPRTSNGLHINNVKAKNIQPKKLFVEEEVLELHPEKKRYVKKVPLGDGYKVNVIVVAHEAYVSGGDLCNLFWTDKEADLLALRLKFKGAIIPTVSVSQNEHEELFFQCKRYSVRDFLDAGKETSIVLYPLKEVLKILNILGHPSSSVREKICKELTNFDAYDVFWNEFQEPKEDEDFLPTKNTFNRLCIYDLKAMHEGLRLKRLKLVRDSQGDSNASEINKIESMQSKIMKQIGAINSICSRYTI